MEYVRHLDVTLDIMQGDIDDLAESLGLNQRVFDLERSLTEESQLK